jgi:hypothetical protein
LLATAFKIASQIACGHLGQPCECVIPSIESLLPILCFWKVIRLATSHVPGLEQCDYFATLHPVYPVMAKSKEHGLVNRKHYVDRFSLPNSLRPSKLCQLYCLDEAVINANDQRVDLLPCASKISFPDRTPSRQQDLFPFRLGRQR